MNALFVLLWLFAVIGAAALIQRLLDAFRHANRVVAEAPRSNVVPFTSSNGVRIIPQRDGRAS